MDHIRTFFEKLQSLDEPRKRTILIVSTAIIMIIVIYFWAVYFNGIVSSAPQAPVADESQPAVPVAGNSSSPTGGLANGTAMIFQFVWNSIASLGRALDGPKQYIIKTQQ